MLHRERRSLGGFLQEGELQRRQERVGATEWMRRNPLRKWGEPGETGQWEKRPRVPTGLERDKGWRERKEEDGRSFTSCPTCSI